jgi:hypothetical protein
MHLITGLSGPDPLEIARALLARRIYGEAPPAALRVDMAQKSPSLDWLERWAPRCKRTISARYGSHLDDYLIYHRDHIVQAAFNFPRSPEAVLALLTELPFTIASFASIHPEWEAVDPSYTAPGFAMLHFPHGWACAFKGAGHAQLVSRRWLDHGPWRVLRGSDDTTLVQFHDLDTDAATALAQAKPGHMSMGISDTGGFLQQAYVYEHDLRGHYNADQRLLKIVILGRDLTSLEMLDACAVRRYQVLGPDQLLERIAYVFLEEERAHAHLHTLWLRDMECWTIRDGVEIRLDVDYTPTAVKPDWVQRLEE